MPNAEYGWNWFVHKKNKIPQTRNKRTRMIRLCDTCRQSWSFYDLTVGFVQDVQRQKCRVRRGVLHSRAVAGACLPRKCCILHSPQFLHLARSICFVKRDYSGVRLCLKLTTPSVNHFYLIFVVFFFGCFRGEFEASMFGVLDSCD